MYQTWLFSRIQAPSLPPSIPLLLQLSDELRKIYSESVMITTSNQPVYYVADIVPLQIWAQVRLVYLASIVILLDKC